MEPALKQRLLGAAVLVALAVVFLPLLVMDPAPDSGASRVSLKVPPAPEVATGDMRTVDLPLAPTPGVSATAMPATPPAGALASDVPGTPDTAAGDYAVNFGSYATSADAARVIAALAAAKLAAYQEPASLGPRTVHRVRIGPFATSADAETARIAAGRVRGDVNAKVVVLDVKASKPASTTTPAATNAPVASTPPVSTAPVATTTPMRTAPLPPTPAAKPVALPPAPAAQPSTTVSAGTDRAVTAGNEPPRAATPPAPPSANAAPAASNVGFAVQLGAFAQAEDADRLRDRARGAGFPAFVEQVRTDRGTLSRVRVGPVPDKAQADALRAQVAGKLGVSGIVRPHP